MVMLYQDPTGESVGTTPSNSLAPPKFITTQSTTSNNADEKVTMLEKALLEKESRINELTLEVKNLKVGVPNCKSALQNKCATAVYTAF